MKRTRPKSEQPRVVRRRVILVGALTIIGGIALTIGAFSFTSRGDSDSAAQRVAHWHGLRVYSPGEGESDWRQIDPGETLDARVVLLIHGLDEPGSIWDELAPALGEAGHATVRFEYPNDQAISDSGELLDTALRRLRARSVERVSIVAHSMGGLVARDALTRPGFADREPEARSAVDRLITIGTPHAGSPWAGMQWASEVREQAERLLGESAPEAEDLYRFSFDGDGQAGADLRPGSPFLTDLNARPAPEDVEFTCLVGQVVTLPPGARGELVALANKLGDGVVPVASAQLEGCEDVVFLSANHRSMIRSLALSPGKTPPPGIEIVLDRLAPP